MAIEIVLLKDTVRGEQRWKRGDVITIDDETANRWFMQGWSSNPGTTASLEAQGLLVQNESWLDREVRLARDSRAEEIKEGFRAHDLGYWRERLKKQKETVHFPGLEAKVETAREMDAAVSKILNFPTPVEKTSEPKSQGWTRGGRNVS